MAPTITTNYRRKIAVIPQTTTSVLLELVDQDRDVLVRATLEEKDRLALIKALQNPNPYPTAKIIEAVRFGVRHVLVQDIDNDELYWSDAGTSYTAEMIRDRFHDITIIKE